MARFTPFLGELSGKLGGNVFARNKGGSYVRGWVKPTNPRTAAQMAVRSSFSSAATAWSSLSEGLKSAWNNYAITYFKPRVIKAGSTYSGFQAFVSLRNAALQAQRLSRSSKFHDVGVTATFGVFAPQSDPPNNLFQGNLTETGEPPVNIYLTAASLEASTAKVTFTFETSIEWGNLTSVWEDPTSEESFGFLVFASGRNNSSQLYQQCLGAWKPPATFDSTIHSSTWEVEMSTADYNTASRKLWYVAGDKIKISVFALSPRGESILVGQVPVTVAV